MKMLFTSTDRAAVGMLRSIVEEAGIQFEVRNEATNANFPTSAFYPELWIIHDEDFAKTVELRDAWRGAPVDAQLPWICPHCGEKLEGQFTSCWKCLGARKEGNEQG